MNCPMDIAAAMGKLNPGWLAVIAVAVVAASLPLSLILVPLGVMGAVLMVVTMAWRRIMPHTAASSSSGNGDSCTSECPGAPGAPADASKVESAEGRASNDDSGEGTAEVGCVLVWCMCVYVHLHGTLWTGCMAFCCAHS